MKKSLAFASIPVLTLLCLSGCIDDKYDLSDIDTTSTLKIKDLTIPVNIETITLGDIITINEGDQIQEVEINGKKVYAVNESGEFNSADIVIDRFISPAPDVQPEVVKVDLAAVTLPAGTSATFPFPNKIERKLIYKSENLDESIEEVTKIFTEGSDFKMIFETSDIQGGDLSLTNLELQMPKGMEIESIIPAGTYDPETGVCKIPKVDFVDEVGEVTMKVKSISLTENDSEIDETTHDLEIDTEFNVEKADLTILAGTSSVTLPRQLDINVKYDLADMEITAVSGKVKYTIKDIHISPVDLTDIPDVLAQEGTNLVLSNPQIYLSLNNPVADYDLGYQVGMELVAERDNSAAKTFSLDNGSFRVEYNKGVDGPYNYCLSPTRPTNIPAEFANPTFVGFSSLGKVLSGDGLPQTIEITLPNTEIYSQTVDHFNLGEEHKLTGMSGKWEFLAPLALASDGSQKSKIIYTKTQSGWLDEDLEALEITALEINAKVDSDLPVDAVLSGYPVGEDGRQINGAKFEPMTIPAGARNQAVTLKLTGKVKNLDGITYTAEIVSANGEALSPDQNFTLKDIRVRVSGNYTKEF